MTIRAGQLDQRVTLLAPADVADVDTYGHPQGEPASLGTFWAGVRGLAGREAEQARQVRAEATHAVTMRDIGVEITTRHALTWHSKFGDKHLEIAQALYDRKAAEWSIVAVETPDDG